MVQDLGGYRLIEELGSGKVDIVYPSYSILAEPPVAVVDTVVVVAATAGVARMAAVVAVPTVGVVGWAVAPPPSLTRPSRARRW